MVGAKAHPMTVTTGPISLVPHRDHAPTAPAVARVELLRELAAAEPVWRALQRDGVTTPYQHFDFLSAWQRHVGPHAATTPLVLVGYDPGGRPQFLWPLGLRRSGPLRVAGFLGGKHANFNFGLWRPEAAARFSAADLRPAIDALRADGGADLLLLLRQPRTWEDVPNPFAQLAHQTSVDECSRLTFSGTGRDVVDAQLSSAMRSRLRNKERKLQKLPGYRCFRAATLAEAERLLTAFFPVKAAHMAAQGLRNVFAEPGVEAFVREICRAGIGGVRPLVEIHALEAEGEMLAFFGAITDGRRISLMFNTYTLSDNARQSPGLILLTHVVGQCADRGMRVFDLGVGEAGYKSFFCKEPEPLIDSVLPLTPLGRAAAPLLRAGLAAKRRVKGTPALWNALQALRRRVRGRPQPS